MDYSVIRTGGKQYIVSNGEELFVEKVTADTTNVTFDTLLRVKGGEVEIGEPVLSASTKGEVIAEEKGDKVQGVKYMSSGYRRKFGHRQHFSKVRIVEI